MQNVRFEFGQFAQHTVRVALKKRIVFYASSIGNETASVSAKGIEPNPNPRLGFLAGVNAQKRIAVFFGHIRRVVGWSSQRR
jgi:hypothetical protein